MALVDDERRVCGGKAGISIPNIRLLSLPGGLPQFNAARTPTCALLYSPPPGVLSRGAQPTPAW